MLDQTSARLAISDTEKQAALAEQQRLNSKVIEMISDIAALEQLRDRLTGEKQELSKEKNQGSMDLILLKRDHAKLSEEKANLESELTNSRLDFSAL